MLSILLYDGRIIHATKIEFNYNLTKLIIDAEYLVDIAEVIAITK